MPEVGSASQGRALSLFFSGARTGQTYSRCSINAGALILKSMSNFSLRVCLYPANHIAHVTGTKLSTRKRRRKANKAPDPKSSHTAGGETMNVSAINDRRCNRPGVVTARSKSQQDNE